MPRPDTLVLDKARNAYVFTDYPTTFDIGTIPEFDGVRIDWGVDPEGTRDALMTRAAAIAHESQRRAISPRNYEAFPETPEGDAAYYQWRDELLGWMHDVDVHLIKHGAIGPTAAKIWGGELEAEAAPAEQSGAKAATTDEPGPLPSALVPQLDAPGAAGTAYSGEFAPAAQPSIEQEAKEYRDVIASLKDLKVAHLIVSEVSQDLALKLGRRLLGLA